MSDPTARDVVAVVLGYNHPEDTIECLHSLAASVPQPPELLYVDNGSRLEACQQVVGATPGVRALRLDPNVGVGRGFNAGIADALARGARWVMVVNNDVIVDPGMVRELMSDAVAHPRAGILVPKIFYHAAPDRIWSAGSRYRRLPPVIVMRKTRSDDRGQLDRRQDLAFATFCVAALRREMLEEIGLLDADFHVFQEDYDLCLRARAGGWGVRYVPSARVWHKVSLSTRAGSRNPESWRLYGRSEALFARKHPDWPWLTGWVHRAYVAARILAEGKAYGLRPFLRGYREGLRAPLRPPPRADGNDVDRAEILRP